MRRGVVIQAVAVCCGVALAGCGTSSAPKSSLTAPTAMTSVHASSAGGNQSATGNAHIVLETTPETILERFSFNAIQHAKGDVTGQWQGFRYTDDTTDIAHGTVTCVGFAGNTAYIGADIEQNNLGVPPGTPVIWTVVDNGEGSGAPPDQTSQIVIVSSVQRDTFCATGLPVLPTYPSEQGNIQVRP